MTELNIVNTGGIIKIKEFKVGLDPGIVAFFRHDPMHVAGDTGRVKVTQDTGPLVTLLDIEFSQIFKADDGVTDALIGQVGGAEIDPLVGKFCIYAQKGQKTGGKGGDPAGGFGARS